VDDSIFNLEALKIIIKNLFPFEPDTAANGQEALDQFQKREEATTGCSDALCQRSKYRLVFMDLNMPVMDGFDASSSILSYQESHPRSNSAGVVILALTAYVDSANVQRCKDIGMKQVLNKPAKAEKIKEAITEHCPGLGQFLVGDSTKKLQSKRTTILQRRPSARKPKEASDTSEV